MRHGCTEGEPVAQRFQLRWQSDTGGGIEKPRSPFVAFRRSMWNSRLMMLRKRRMMSVSNESQWASGEEQCRESDLRRWPSGRWVLREENSHMDMKFACCCPFCDSFQSNIGPNCLARLFVSHKLCSTVRSSLPLLPRPQDPPLENERLCGCP